MATLQAEPGFILATGRNSELPKLSDNPHLRLLFAAQLKRLPILGRVPSQQAGGAS